MYIMMRAATTLCAAFAGFTGQLAGPDPVDLLRIDEAFRLTEAVQDSVWPGGFGMVPFPLLLVTAEREFLMGFPGTPPGFTEGQELAPFDSRVLERPRELQENLLATFPLFGPPSLIVVGRPEATGKTSTSWVLTLLHERFHQFQTADTAYYAAVEHLDLAGDDQTGMWMLNYPFPYDSPGVVQHFETLSRDLARLLDGSTAAQRATFWTDYVAFLEGLSGRDRRYLSFQIWQEGVARYVELRAAAAAARVFTPSAAFTALPDYRPFADVADELLDRIRDDLANPDLAGRKRVSFYAFGAGLGLLLDEDVPDWKSRYLTEKFAVERYITSSATTTPDSTSKNDAAYAHRLAIFMEATPATLDSLRSQYSEEDFAVVADDMMYYRALAYEYLERLGVEVVRMQGRAPLKFLVDGNARAFEFMRGPSADLVVLYEPGRMPLPLAPVDIDRAAEYFGIRDR